MKISDSLRLTQKRNFMVFLHDYSLHINSLDFVKELIYDTKSHDIATKIANQIPKNANYAFDKRIFCERFCDNFIEKAQQTKKDFYLVLKKLNLCYEPYGLVSRPSFPVLILENKNINFAYQTFYRNHEDYDHILFCSTDYKVGVFVDVYADRPTPENGMRDDDRYYCYQWFND